MKRRHRVASTLFRMALAFGLLGLAVGWNREQITKVLRGKPDIGLFVLGLGFYLSGMLLAFTRWFLLVRAVGLPFRLRDAMRLGFIATLFNFVIPGAVFGNVVKATFLCRENPERRPAAIASVVADFLCGVLGLFLLAACAGTIASRGLDPRVGNLVIFAWIATGLATSALAIGLWKGRVGFYRGHIGVILLGVAMGLGTHAMNVLAFFAVSRAMFGAAVPGLGGHFLMVPLVVFTTAFPLPFGALGLSEQASYALFRLMNYSGGAVAMLGFRLLQIAGAAIGAVVYMVNARQVRHLADRELEPASVDDGRDWSR